MNGKTVRAMRRIARREGRNVAPALAATVEYARSTEERVAALELSVGAHTRMFERNLWGRLLWLFRGAR